MRPINNCLKNHVNLRKKDGGAPQWLFFHDVDEYIFPTDTNATISQALMRRSKTCCLQVGAAEAITPLTLNQKNDTF